jgi:hypothetical protein
MKRVLVLGLLSLLAGSTPAFSAPLIINEWNAVGEEKFLGGGAGQDTFFDANYVNPTANGGNWVELVVTQDHLDIRGWQLAWTNGDPDAGSLTFTNNALWADVRSGTIITLREDDDGDLGNPVGARPSDVSFNPGANDFWLEINIDDPLYIVDGGFKVDNDDWAGSIFDEGPALVQGPIGEGAGAPWVGGGINSEEAGQLAIDPTATPIAVGYLDVSYSSYGAPNWLNASGTNVQDFSDLRLWVPEPGSLALAVFGACGGAALAWRRRRKR